MTNPGAIAAGHEETAMAAQAALLEGGNAFDAAVAALLGAFVAEPLLASPGGGGFLLACPAGRPPHVYDFFARTPLRRRNSDDIDFSPIDADFGGAVQVFHIGLGSVATPGAVRGLFDIHRDLCRLPMARHLSQAAALARRGVVVNSLQGRIFSILEPILGATTDARALFASPADPARIIAAGERFRNPFLADLFEALTRHGDAFFYEGELASRMADLVAPGGHLRRTDFETYRTVRREPLAFRYRSDRILANPPPSSGGLLVAFALRLLEGVDLRRLGPASAATTHLLADVMALTNKARLDVGIGQSGDDAVRLLDPDFLEAYRAGVAARAAALRGTTHISVMDGEGNMAGLSISNGEGCGSAVPGAGFMLNNMLGEEDLNPAGFHHWPEGRRMTSMMTPTAVFRDDGTRLIVGTGGSNRIRTAILQVLLNRLDFSLSLEDAIARPRLHYENDCLDVEPGFTEVVETALRQAFPSCSVWDHPSMFFGGTHAVEVRKGRFTAVGDPRRGGVGIVVAP